MKKIIFLLVAFIVLACFPLVSLGTEEATEVNSNNAVAEDTAEQDDEPEKKEEKQSKKEEEKNGKMNQASEEIIGTMSKKEERIQFLTEKYNNKALGTVAYGLEVVRFYSTPIFFIFLVMGAFNFFIVGNKKLDKKEQGFGWITACVVGWIFFQCLPLLFALLTIGARK